MKCKIWEKEGFSAFGLFWLKRRTNFGLGVASFGCTRGELGEGLRRSILFFLILKTPG